MANNDFLVFGGNGTANVIDQASYSAMDARMGGFSIGIAKSAQANKVWRQSSIMAAVLAQFIVDETGQDAVDDGTAAKLLGDLKRAVPAAVNAVGVNTGATLNGVNGANLLVNGSGELGRSGWRGANFQPIADANGRGSIFLNGAAITAAAEDVSNPIACGPGVSMTVSAEMTTAGVTAGRAYVACEALNASGVSLGLFAGPASIANGTNWTYVSATGVTPTGTAMIAVHRGVDTAPSVGASGLGFRRIKLERGAMPSLYSQEAGLGLLSGSSPVVGAARNLAITLAAESASATVVADEIVVVGNLGEIGYKLANFSMVIDLTKTGIGGVVGAALTPGGFAGIYAAFNPSTGQAGVFAVNANARVPEIASAPPAGWVATALVSVWRLSAGGKLVAGNQFDREVQFPFQTVLTAKVTTPVATPLSVASVVPVNAKSVSGSETCGASTPTTIWIDVSSSVSRSGGQGTNGTSTSLGCSFYGVQLITPQTLFYYAGADGGQPIYWIFISGYRF